MKVSVIIPAYNEEKTVVAVLAKVSQLVIPHDDIEILVIDDGSDDNTKEVIQNFINSYHGNNIQLFSHATNMGKGAAVKMGIAHASGDFIVIQDADLEYDPKYIPILLSHLSSYRQVVYGTRLNRLPHLQKEENHLLFLTHYFGNRFLSFLTSVLYGQWLTDMETCYKVFPKVAVKKMSLHAKGFEFEPEITAKLLKAGYRIVEVPITTRPRGYGEGKKLHTIRDGVKALNTLIKYRFVS